MTAPNGKAHLQIGTYRSRLHTRTWKEAQALPGVRGGEGLGPIGISIYL